MGRENDGDYDHSSTKRYTYAFSCDAQILFEIQAAALQGVERFSHELMLTWPKNIINLFDKFERDSTRLNVGIP